MVVTLLFNHFGRWFSMQVLKHGNMAKKTTKNGKTAE